MRDKFVDVTSSILAYGIRLAVFFTLLFHVIVAAIRHASAHP